MELSKYTIFLEISGKNIIFNTLYGSIDILDCNIYQILQKKEFSKLKTFEYNYLKERHYFCDIPKDNLEEMYKKKISEYAKESSRFYLSLSYNCNFKCTYCFENLLDSKEHIKESNVNNIFLTIDKIISEVGSTFNEIVLFGGEPLLNTNREIIERIFKYTKNREFKISVITNGSNIYIYKDLIIKYKDIISNFSITLDGPKKIHNNKRFFKNGLGTYDHILEGIKILSDLEIETSIRINLDKDSNYNIIEFINELKVVNKELRFLVSRVEDNNTENNETILSNLNIAKKLVKEEFFHHMDEQKINLNIKIVRNIYNLITRKNLFPNFRYCRMSELFMLTPNGDLYMCPESCELEEFKIGRITNESVIDYNKITQLKNMCSFNFENCSECSLAPICGGNCYIKRANYLKNCSKEYCNKEDILETIKYMIDRRLDGQI